MKIRWPLVTFLVALGALTGCADESTENELFGLNQLGVVIPEEQWDIAAKRLCAGGRLTDVADDFMEFNGITDKDAVISAIRVPASRECPDQTLK